MSYSKTKEEINLIKEACRISALAMKEVKGVIKPGVTTLEIDQLVENIFINNGATSAFKRVEDYKYTICSTPNDWVVHGIPDKRPLKDGDIVGIDLGAYYKGYNSDMAHTFVVGNVTEEVKKFLKVGEETLFRAIKEAKPGNKVGDISAQIQEGIESHGYSVVRELVGHGVGKELHENPMIPGRGRKGTGEKLIEGMVIAIEIIYNFGKPHIVLLDDGWTIATKDKSLGGLFERTVLVSKDGPVVLTA